MNDSDMKKYIVQPDVAYLEYIKRAERSGKLKGWACKVEKYENGGYYAKVTIKRDDWDIPFEWEVALDEVLKETPDWTSQPLFMLRKVCISQAFRMCFPGETNDLPDTYEEA